jgi:hypothetical protein
MHVFKKLIQMILKIVLVNLVSFAMAGFPVATIFMVPITFAELVIKYKSISVLVLFIGFLFICFAGGLQLLGLRNDLELFPSTVADWLGTEVKPLLLACIFCSYAWDIELIGQFASMFGSMCADINAITLWLLTIHSQVKSVVVLKALWILSFILIPLMDFLWTGVSKRVIWALFWFWLVVQNIIMIAIFYDMLKLVNAG